MDLGRTIRVKYLNSDGRIKSEKKGTDYVQHYRDAAYHSVGLEKCPRNLLEYLTLVMDDQNMVSSGIDDKRAFIEWMKQVPVYDRKKKLCSPIIYSEGTVGVAFNTLNNIGFLTKIRNGKYQMNPEFFWKADINDRIRTLQLVLTFKSRENPSEDECFDIHTIREEMYNREPGEKFVMMSDADINSVLRPTPKTPKK